MSMVTVMPAPHMGARVGAVLWTPSGVKQEMANIWNKVVANLGKNDPPTKEDIVAEYDRITKDYSELNGQKQAGNFFSRGSLTGTNANRFMALERVQALLNALKNPSETSFDAGIKQNYREFVGDGSKGFVSSAAWAYFKQIMAPQIALSIALLPNNVGSVPS